MSMPLRLNWRLIAGCAVLLTILFGIQQWAALPTLRRDLDLPQAIALQGITWGAWLLLLALIVRVADRHPLERRPTVAWGARTIVEGAAFVLVHALIAGATRWAVGLSV